MVSFSPPPVLWSQPRWSTESDWLCSCCKLKLHVSTPNYDFPRVMPAMDLEPGYERHTGNGCCWCTSTSFPPSLIPLPHIFFSFSFTCRVYHTLRTVRLLGVLRGVLLIRPTWYFCFCILLVFYFYFYPVRGWSCHDWRWRGGDETTIMQNWTHVLTLSFFWVHEMDPEREAAVFMMSRCRISACSVTSFFLAFSNLCPFLLLFLFFCFLFPSLSFPFPSPISPPQRLRALDYIQFLTITDVRIIPRRRIGAYVWSDLPSPLHCPFPLAEIITPRLEGSKGGCDSPGIG